jgi:hypothetical protein
MNNIICAREDQTLAATRSGTIDHDTAQHAQHCPKCAEILLLSQFLRDESNLTHQEQTALPSPRQIWQKAQNRSQEYAVRLALRPIRFMKIAAVIAFLCAPWLRSLLPAGTDMFGSWTKNFGIELDLISRMWPAMASQGVILLGFAAATILLSVSSWYMVRQE